MRLRLFLSFTIIVVVSVISVVLIARQNAANEVRAFMFRGGMSDSDDLVKTLEDYYKENRSWLGADNLLRTSAGHMGQGQGRMMDQRLRLANANGELVSDSSGSSVEGDLTNEELQSAIPIEVNGEIVGYLYAEGGMNINRQDELSLINRLNQAAFTAALIAGGLSLLIALFLAYRLIKPVRELTAAAQKLGIGDLSSRVPVRGNDELAVLGRTFNQMADSLELARESRKAMTADLAHELRNPLAVQRANLEALQDGIYPLTTENLQPVIEQNLLLTHLVNDLRTLALADAGQLELEYTWLDLQDMLGRIVHRFQPQAKNQEVQLVFQAIGNIPAIFVDPMRVEQILGNILNNALRYTPQGGVIRVSLESSRDRVKLLVHDSGPGIPEEILPHIFERFYRGDRARSRREGGSGLGLAIARQLAQAQRGTLEASNHPNGGAIFTLILPIEYHPTG